METKTQIKFFTISNNRVVCHYDNISTDRTKAFELASKIGGEPLELFSNGIVFNSTDTKQLTKLINTLTTK